MYFIDYMMIETSNQKQEVNQMKVKYYGSFSVNNGSTSGNGYEFTNKKEARQTMREIARGNVCFGNTGSWTVTTHDGEEVASGRVRG